MPGEVAVGWVLQGVTMRVGREGWRCLRDRVALGEG